MNCTPVLFRRSWFWFPVLLVMNHGWVSAADPIPVSSSAPSLIRIACVGDSNTQAGRTSNPRLNSYPSQLQRMLGPGYVVGNFGASGHTLLIQGDAPYQARAILGSLNFAPDIVVIMLGTNDAKPKNWAFKDRFIPDYLTMIERYRALPSKPKIYLCTPLPVRGPGGLGIPPEPIAEQILMIGEIAKQTGLDVIDIHAAVTGHEETLTDNIHVNDEGSRIVAETVFRTLRGKPFSGELDPYLRTDWQGFQRLEFAGPDGSTGTIVLPHTPATGRPSLIRCGDWGMDTGLQLALLTRGWHILHITMEPYRVETQVARLEELWKRAQREFQLGSKVVIESFGTGSLAACAWAAGQPERIKGLYLDAPLLDLATLDPAKIDSSLPEPIRSKREKEWGRILERLTPKSFDGIATSPLNPLPHLRKLAAAQVPLMLVHASDDTTVIPQKVNVQVAAEIYQNAQMPVTRFERPIATPLNFGLPSPTPLVEWVEHLQP